MNTSLSSTISTLTTTSPNNTSSPPLPLSAVVPSMLILVLAFVLGFPGNVFVAWTVVFRLHRRSVTSLLILHLACADAVVLLTAPLFLRYLAAGGDWEFGDVACRCVHYLCCVNMYASVLLIAFMSLDRLLGVSRPFLSQKVRTKSKVWRVVAAIWAAALVLALPMPFYRHMEWQGHKRKCLVYHPTNAHLVFQYLLETLASFVVPFSVMAFSYCRISRQLSQGGGGGRFQWRRRSRRKSGRLIALIVVSFALFWAPYHLVNVLQVAGTLSSSTALLKFSKMVRPVLTALAFLSSSANPVLYAFAGSTFIRSAGLGFVAKLLEGTSSDTGSKKSRMASREKEGEGGRREDGEGDSVRLGPLSVAGSVSRAGREGKEGQGEKKANGEK
ncbi:leukotriene B4 receptor 1 [Amia ocellicauda]|uniref:leukotriene B4 receptor 1 n=1 Tax=Amia ocellicauda TaxID=2972642 RepID=UPI0034647B41